MQLNIFQYACLQNYKPFGARAITVRELCISVISFYSAAISPTPQRLYIQITKVIDKKFHEINIKYIYYGPLRRTCFVAYLEARVSPFSDQSDFYIYFNPPAVRMLLMVLLPVA